MAKQQINSMMNKNGVMMMKMKKAISLLSTSIGLMVMIFSPTIANNVELHSVYGDVTRSYFTYIAYTVSFSVLGLAAFLSGIIGYYMNNKK